MIASYFSLKYKLSSTILIVLGILYFLLFTSYGIYRIFPIVHLGPYRSWPLYFFFLDGITLIITVIDLVGIVSSILKKQKDILVWLLIVFLLGWPLFNVGATYHDITREYCLDPSCTTYMPGSDLTSIYLNWEEK